MELLIHHAAAARRLFGTHSVSMCRAILVSEYGEAEKLVLGEKDIPAPASGQVQVRVSAAGVNPSDTYKVLGPAGPYGPTGTNTPWMIPQLPYTPGGDGAGVVSALGDGVTDFAVGDRVYLMTPLEPSSNVSGTFAEFACVDANQVYPLPDSISFAQGAGIGVPAATAYRALWQRGQLQPTESLFVHGASGGVGLAAVSMAAAAGCFVVGSAGSTAGLEAVKAAGAHAVVNHRTERYLTEAKDALPEGASGFDVVLENFAHLNLPADLGITSQAGRICVVGSRAQEVPLNPRLAMANEVDIRGVFLPLCGGDEMKAIHAELFKMMEASTFVPVVGLEFALEDAAKSHVEVMTPSGGGAMGNIVVHPWPAEEEGGAGALPQCAGVDCELSQKWVGSAGSCWEGLGAYGVLALARRPKRHTASCCGCCGSVPVIYIERENAS